MPAISVPLSWAPPLAAAAGKAAPAIKLLPDVAGKWGGIPPGGAAGSQAA